ncbi:aldolase [Candidatus Dojkabacteria bacterium]|uniref:Aldolase n=1 Tax=Candidatus Dojkabacteria bacterium TaxID=2099670 RepID=A0A5C7J402_9BACT|nr:MAG: aldolase [Candidatus Dojkabacteria bacterium]
MSYILAQNMESNTDIDALTYTATLSDNSDERLAAQKRIRELGRELGIFSASMHNIYSAFGRGELSGFTVPAMNVRMLTYDFAHRAFLLAIKHNIGCMIFELANTEQQYTNQPPSEYSASIIAGAIRARYKGPVFIQGDHYQMKADIFKQSPEKEIERVKNLIDRSLEGDFFNIDIDGSTLVDLSKTNLDEQQKNNYEMTALMTRYIREKQPKDIMVSIGGEIGHIGGINSTVEDFEAFMKGYKPLLGDVPGISKVAIQTGTSHGGVPLPDGTIAEVDIDFDAIHKIGDVARNVYGLGGPVQHGASTLPASLFNEFPKHNTLEIHLATEFQNIVYAHMNNNLKEKMWAWLRENAREELKEGMTDEQFIYKSRKKAWGNFKKDMWNLPQEEKTAMLDALTEKLESLFNSLQVLNTKDAVARFI